MSTSGFRDTTKMVRPFVTDIGHKFRSGDVPGQRLGPVARSQLMGRVCQCRDRLQPAATASASEQNIVPSRNIYHRGTVLATARDMVDAFPTRLLVN